MGSWDSGTLTLRLELREHLVDERIQGSKTFVSPKSSLESDKEEKKKIALMEVKILGP